MHGRSPQLIAFFLSLFLVMSTASAGAGTFLTRQLRAPRVAKALKVQSVPLREAFVQAQAAWPPRDLFLRGFKHEGLLEVWAGASRGGGLVRIWALPLCASSGVMGPKRREGDGQIPEGVYRINRFNPRSAFHLSLGLNYPTSVDHRRAAGQDPGSDIFIHGGCASIGCLAIEDGPIEMLYLAAVMARDRGQRHLPVHLYPCRFGTPACEAELSAYAADNPGVLPFWRTLRAKHDGSVGATYTPEPRVEAAPR